METNSKYREYEIKVGRPMENASRHQLMECIKELRTQLNHVSDLIFNLGANSNWDSELALHRWLDESIEKGFYDPPFGLQEQITGDDK